MATQNEVKLKKREVKELIKRRLREDPDIGPHEFVGQFLQTRGIDVDIQDPEAIRSKVKELNGRDKSDTVRALSEYRKYYDKAITDLDKGMHHDITKLPRVAIATITKGAGIGVGVATTVNTIAPGLFSTTAGYLAGAGIVSESWLVNAGLLTTGIFAPTTVSAGAVLAVGAVTGAVTYTAGKLVVSGITSLVTGIKEKMDDKKYGKEER